MAFQFLTLLSLMIAAGALIITTLTYRRNRRLENENHIYKIKTEVYGQLTQKAYELVNYYEDAYFEIKEALETANPKQIDFDKYADDIDLKGYRFEKEAAANSLLLPQKVLDSLEDFIDSVLYGEEPEGEKLEAMHETLLLVYEKVETLINDFRSDLNVQMLNESLFRRIK
jgi:hypothetical protein